MPVEFANEAQRTTYDKVAGLLREEFGRQAIAYEDRPGFAIKTGSAITAVYIEPIGDHQSCVRVLSWVVTGAEQSPELHVFLLRSNLGMRFGAFGIDDGGDIMFTHALHGETVTHDALMFSVYGVAQVADDMDDEIVQRFGGQRAVDRG